MRRSFPRPWSVRGWRLWVLPRPAVGFLLFVEAGAIGVTVVATMLYPVDADELRIFGILVVLGVLFAEATRRVERMRRWFSHTPHVNMSSVWTLSAALLVSPALAAATAVVLYAHLWARSWYSVSGVQPFRIVFNTCVVVLSCQAAATISRSVPGVALAPSHWYDLVKIVAIVGGYTVVNSGLAAIALFLLHRRRELPGLLGSWQENSIEFATLSLGMLTAAVLVWRPPLAVLVLLPMYVLHRGVLIRQLEYAVTVDERTGLLNATTWHHLAATEFERARRHDRAVCLLMADLDHFTQVNDQCGRDVGDAALGAVGAALRQELRSGDLCGRLGGEEFAVLLAETDIEDAVAVANRICERIRTMRVIDAESDIRLSMSIGVAAHPDAGSDLEELLLAADNALFAAKDAGRNRASAVQSQVPGSRG